MWHHQRFSLKTQSRTHAKMSDLMWMRQDEEKKKDHRLIRVTPSIQTLEIPERAIPSEAKKRSKYRIRTHMNGVRPTQSPDPAPEVTRPQSPGWPPRPCSWVWHNPWLGQQVSAGWAPKAETSGFLWFPGMVERSVGLVPSPQTCRRDVLLLSVVLTDINYFYSCTIALNTLPWFWQARSFLVPLRCWETHWALEDEGQVWSLLSMGCLLEGDHSSNLTCCPLAFCLIHVPCNPFTKWICLPSRYAHASELE